LNMYCSFMPGHIQLSGWSKLHNEGKVDIRMNVIVTIKEKILIKTNLFVQLWKFVVG
jgi:hypothetical protein